MRQLTGHPLNGSKHERLQRCRKATEIRGFNARLQRVTNLRQGTYGDSRGPGAYCKPGWPMRGFHYSAVPNNPVQLWGTL